MKLAYTNWHKESVHDDAIRGELMSISENQLEYHPGNAPVGTTSFSAGGGQPTSSSGEQFRSGKRKNFQQNKFKGGGNSGNKGNNSNKHNKQFNKNRNK